jgi:uncharacterized protein (DUF3084 family)
MKIATHALRCALLGALALSFGAQAQAPAAPKTVTRDELRTCMNSETELAARRESMAPRDQKNREEAQAIRAESEQMAEEQKRAEGNSTRMDRFNRRVKAHNARIEAVNAAIATFRADLEALNQSLIAHNQQCGGITFRPEDREAILKEREAARK